MVTIFLLWIVSSFVVIGIIAFVINNIIVFVLKQQLLLYFLLLFFILLLFVLCLELLEFFFTRMLAGKAFAALALQVLQNNIHHVAFQTRPHLFHSCSMDPKILGQLVPRRLLPVLPRQVFGAVRFGQDVGHAVRRRRPRSQHGVVRRPTVQAGDAFVRRKIALRSGRVNFVPSFRRQVGFVRLRAVTLGVPARGTFLFGFVAHQVARYCRFVEWIEIAPFQSFADAPDSIIVLERRMFQTLDGVPLQRSHKIVK
mmetsp:Transcript_15696/g.34347  ORF Transcript_15696/g.34347 Transcript_15696/m.34347 type:complete len:255 (-) Transcript_15696:962-1726(-)